MSSLVEVEVEVKVGVEVEVEVSVDVGVGAAVEVGVILDKVKFYFFGRVGLVVGESEDKAKLNSSCS